jgi:hypothetical protein
MRAARRRISRRRALQSGLAVTAAAWLFPLAACDDDDDSGGGPRSGGTLRYGSPTAFSYGLDPHLEQGGGLAAIARAYGYMFHVDPRDDSLVLDNGASVEQPESGVYVVRLAERGFHDAAPANGRAVTGDDVVSSMMRYRDHPFVTGKWWHTRMLSGAGATNARTVLVRTSRALGDI